MCIRDRYRIYMDFMSGEKDEKRRKKDQARRECNNFICDNTSHVEGYNNICGDLYYSHSAPIVHKANHVEGYNNVDVYKRQLPLTHASLTHTTLPATMRIMVY